MFRQAIGAFEQKAGPAAHLVDSLGLQEGREKCGICDLGDLDNSQETVFFSFSRWYKQREAEDEELSSSEYKGLPEERAVLSALVEQTSLFYFLAKAQ